MSNLLSRIICRLRSGTAYNLRETAAYDDVINFLIKSPAVRWEIVSPKDPYPGQQIYTVSADSVPLWVGNFPHSFGKLDVGDFYWNTCGGKEAASGYRMNAGEIAYPVTRFALASKIMKELPIARNRDVFYYCTYA
jgi:hypothetical protein